jgi:hypothetical protein
MDSGYACNFVLVALGSYAAVIGPTYEPIGGCHHTVDDSNALIARLFRFH